MTTPHALQVQECVAMEAASVRMALPKYKGFRV